MKPNPTSKPIEGVDALLARVEAATGPDEELDREIALAFGWTIYDGMGVMTRMRDPEGLIGAHNAPEFTASLNAALALCSRVLPGWEWQIDGRTRDGVYQARLDEYNVYGAEGEASANTPALALLAAMLRALISQQGDVSVHSAPE